MRPRLFGIPATRAPIVGVIRRGPSGWTHVGAWDTARGTYSPGSWLHARIYPQRCDVSPDGRWLVYMALKGSARWDAGPTYVAISRLPWLTALAAWRTCGTWTRGLHFADRRRTWDAGDPDVGDVTVLRRRYGLEGTAPATFLVERRRGWRETTDTPGRAEDDPWDERRANAVVMEKPRPGDGATLLLVSGRFAAFRGGSPLVGPPAYTLAGQGARQALTGIQWADWDASGRLLVATDEGEIQVRDAPFGARAVVWSHDLAPLRPSPAEPPSEARAW